jgi:hypothetical protein
LRQRLAPIPAKVRQALLGGFASPRILEVHGERLLTRNFAPGFRIELHQKDLSLALDGAKTLGVSLPNTATCQELFNACVANGLGKSDHSAMVRAIELLLTLLLTIRTNEYGSRHELGVAQSHVRFFCNPPPDKKKTQL